MDRPAQVVFDRARSYSPVITPLGPRRSILETFGGGSGTVAVHTWSPGDVFGARSHDGHIRVPANTLDRMTAVPFGTFVLIHEE